MRENFMDTAESILRFRTSRDPFVRKMVITLIPTLAVYDTQTFSEHFLHKAMGHLLTLLGKSNDREFGTHDLPVVTHSHSFCSSIRRYRARRKGCW
jgi:hypothetical protein